MKLVPKQFGKYNPVVVLMAVGFVGVGGYPLLMMSGPAIVWVPRGVFGTFDWFDNPDHSGSTLEETPDLEVITGSSSTSLSTMGSRPASDGAGSKLRTAQFTPEDHSRNE